MKQAFSYEDWAIGMMFGMAIGDAMGAPIEFQPSREPENYVRHYMTGGAHNVSKGEFTDDTSMALAMADAFIEANDFNPALIMDNFLKWKNEGAYSPRGVMFDCGNTVHAALRAYEKDNTDPFTGSTDPMSAGNGGLMRLAPAIIAGRYRDEAVHFAKETTRLTHGAEEALKYSAALAEELWQQEALDGYADLKHSTDIDRHQVMSGGYVKETYQAAWWAFQTTDCFEDCIIKAINRGHDSDTTGAVAGMIAGAIYGFSAIPDWMIDGLQWKHEIEQYTHSLMRVGRRKTPRAEIDRIQNQLPSADAAVGDIVVVDGHKCICICPWASYGGGSLSLWAVEGHSAQLTSRNLEVRQGYINGTCIKIDETSNAIHFETNALRDSFKRSKILQLGLEESVGMTQTGDKSKARKWYVSDRPKISSQAAKSTQLSSDEQVLRDFVEAVKDWPGPLTTKPEVNEILVSLVFWKRHSLSECNAAIQNLPLKIEEKDLSYFKFCSSQILNKYGVNKSKSHQQCAKELLAAFEANKKYPEPGRQQRLEEVIADMCISLKWDKVDTQKVIEQIDDLDIRRRYKRAYTAMLDAYEPNPSTFKTHPLRWAAAGFAAVIILLMIATSN